MTLKFVVRSWKFVMKTQPMDIKFEDYIPILKVEYELREILRKIENSLETDPIESEYADIPKKALRLLR